ncbi:hypothetical protein [Limnohabitans sp. Jir72]|uniref:hypothetical protein n=1 Tax=Limnohabitans sp. Jir72 TaxID=1977909 RepID=UPI0011B29AFD|nr:hypothetical protein [Limnohabitans sp. Jir72]
MDTNTQAELMALEAKSVRDKARKRLQSAINTLQRSMYDLECILEKLDEAQDDSKRARHMNAAINHLVCNIQPNLRIDLLANSQAELAVLAVQGAAE